MNSGDKSNSNGTSSRTGRLQEIALLFTKLGFTAFGGPAAHVAMMEDEVVTRRKWLDREHFLDLVATLNFIPGPNSTELAIHLGLIRGGVRGLIVAGFCFITPAVLIILPMAWLYVHYAGAGVQPPAAVRGALLGISAVVLVILVQATWRFAPAAIKSRTTIAVALLTFPAEVLLRHYTSFQPEIMILAAAACMGVLASWWPERARRVLPAIAYPIGLPSLLTAVQTPAMPSAALGEFARLAWFFLKVGGTLFGSGYVLVSYLDSGLVEQLNWLTQRQLADAVAVGQVTPGPLLTTATFIGFVRGYEVTGSDAGGVVGAIVSTAAIFTPAFLLVALFGRFLPAIRAKAWARNGLDLMNAAVVALLVITTFRFAMNLAPNSSINWISVVIAIVAAFLVFYGGMRSIWVVLLGAIAGFMLAP